MSGVQLIYDRKSISLNQPCHAGQIDDAMQQSFDGPVMRAPVNTWSMIDGDRNHFAAAANDERRQKAMHMIEMRYPQKGIADEDLNSAARVRSFVLQNSTANAIRDTRTKQTPEGITPFVAKSGNHLQR